MIEVAMTGREDREGPWKFAIAGLPGTGKTLLCSTMEGVLFVFFNENPRIKSIAGRHIPHVKLLNEYDEGGHVTVAAHDKLNAVITWLLLTDDHGYESLVVDTGSELQQRMKEARRSRNNGEFSASDWGWLSDTYRDVVNSLIDLPMNVAVTYWLKTVELEDGVRGRELALQGSAVDEAPGWFDVVGALDVHEVVGEDGEAETKRTLLTHSSRMYPWVKDHSGALPSRFDISSDFVGDFKRIMALVTADVEKVADKAVLSEVPEIKEDAVASGAEVPTPEKLQAKKDEHQPPGKEKPSSEPDAATSNDPGVADKPEETVNAEPGTEPLETTEKDTPSPEDSGGSSDASSSGPVEGSVAPPTPEISDEQEKAPEPVWEEPPGVAPIPSDPDVQEAQGSSQDEQGEQPTPEEAQANVEEALGGKEVYVCAECGTTIEDEGMLDISQVRFREYLCKPHFKERLAASN